MIAYTFSEEPHGAVRVLAECKGKWWACIVRSPYDMKVIDRLARQVFGIK